MRDLIRPLIVIVLVLLVPVVPFLLWGPQMESWANAWQDRTLPAGVTAILVVALLSTDILLPIPSSIVNTIAGSQLGAVGGTFACWVGMNVSAVVGFALARYWGRPLVERMSKPEQLRRMESLNSRYGPGILVIFRAVPVLAEASVLMVGLHRLSWQRFLPPVLLSNLGIAFAYACFGQVAARHQWLPLALGISVALPVLLTLAVQAWLAARTG